MAACIGREFSHELLRAVSSLSDSALRDGLAQLLDAELVFRSSACSPPSIGPHGYAFWGVCRGAIRI